MDKRVVTTNDVTIKQVSVEIKVIKIDKKQMTLAVFKQLPEVQIIDYSTGTLLGIPWGIVNYHPDSACKEAVPHFHVVWQKGNILCRAAIEKRWGVPMLPEGLEYADDEPNPLTLLLYEIELYLLARLVDGWVPDKMPSRKRKIDLTMNGRTFSFSLNEHASTFLEESIKRTQEYQEKRERYERWEKDYKDNPDGYYARYIVGEREAYQKYTQQMEDQHKEIIAHLQKNEHPVSSTDLYQNHLLPAFANYLQLKETWKQTYHQLEQLEQLFIAV